MEKELTSAAIWPFLDDLSEGVLVVNSDGSLQYMNRAAKSLFGLTYDAAPLAGVEQHLKAGDVWNLLQNPPAETIIDLPNGRSLQLQSTRHHHLHDDPYIQILVQPHQQTTRDYEADAVVDQLTSLARISSEPDFDKKLQLIVDGLQTIGWNRVGLTLRDEEFVPTKIITAGFSQEERRHIMDNILPPETWQNLFQNESLQQYRHGSCYFVPGDSAWAQENLGTILPDHTAPGQDPNSWHAKDLLCAVLYDRDRRKIGLLGLDQPRNGRRPGRRMMQTIELYAQIAASVIENAQLVEEAVERNRELEILFAASNELSSTLDKETVFATLGHHMQQAVNADGYTIYRWHETQNQLVVQQDYSSKPNRPIHAEGAVVTLFNDGKSDVVRQVLHTQQPRILRLHRSEPFPLPPPPWLSGDNYLCALIPLLLSDETYGLIHVVKRGWQRRMGQRERQLLVALANQASTILETVFLFEDTYEREKFYNALGNVNMAINFTLESKTVLNLICNEALRIFDVDGAYIWQLEGNYFIGRAAKGHGAENFVGSRVSLTETAVFVTQLADKRQAIYLNHLANNSDIDIKLPAADAIQSVLGVPLEQEGRIIGILILADVNHPARFSDKDASWATVFGVQVAIALQNANLFAELRRFNEELDSRVAERTRALNEESNRVKILLRITTELSASLDPDRVLNQALNLVNGVVNATQGAILLINQETGELMFRAVLGTDAQEISPKGIPSGLMRDEGLAGWMIENRSAVIVHDTHTDPRWIELPNSKQYRSVLGVPLITNEEAIGVMMLFHTELNAFTTQQLDLVEAAAIQVANAINNASLYQLIFNQADQLGSMLRSERIQRANLQAILESIADGVIVANSDSEIDLVNVPASNILGIPREQLTGKSINELIGLFSSFERSWLEVIDDWSRNADRIEPGTLLADQLTIEDKVLSVHLSPVISDKQFFGTVSIFRDITKEVEVDRLKSEFVSTVSHELRTPMTSIKGYVDLMLMGAAGDIPQGQSRYLKVIKNNADRLHMLVNDLLNISRIETGRTTLDLRPLDLPQIISQVVEGHLNGRIQHEGKQLTVHTNISQELPLINADKARVTQILTNLLDNAFNYTPEPGEIHVTAEANDIAVYITVADTGIGIARENLPKIFDRFYRAEDEAVQKVPGTGLGLAIVQSLIEMHGGKLIVDSEPGHGSRFTFNLPVVLEDGDLPAL